jgi:HEAT repeat protein
MALVENKIGEREFLEAFPHHGDPRSLGASILRAALDERDPDGVELGLYVACCLGFDPSAIDVLCALAEADWHTRHEDVVTALAKLGPERCVDVLYRTARRRFPYLAYDDARALGVKAVHALGKAESVEAVARLAELKESDEHVVREEAAKELARLAAHGKTPEVRAKATR